MFISRNPTAAINTLSWNNHTGSVCKSDTQTELKLWGKKWKRTKTNKQNKNQTGNVVAVPPHYETEEIKRNQVKLIIKMKKK